MNKLIPSRPPVRLRALSFLAGAVLVSAAQAADVSCTASITGQGATGQVVLPETLMTDYPLLGSTAGWTRFHVELSACNAASLQAWTYFHSGHANTSTGRLNNIPGIGQAAGVDLELTDGKRNPIQAWQGTTWGSGHSPTFGFNGAGVHRMDYGVQYYRFGAIQPGAIRTNVNYVVFFQ